MATDVISESGGKSDFWQGVRLSMPVVVASAPFAVLFGALAVDNGFSVLEAFLMSALVYGGASQMVGIQLFGQHVAPWLVVLSIFAVNFRHVLYSAGIGRRIAHWPVISQALGY
ncbi:MAG: branched-chain amino acid ABC transporter permease, partial [Mesorhizobium sp.]